MTQDEIIEMAKQAGGMFSELPMMDAWVFDDDDKSVEAFANLVAQHEREACAKVAKQISDKYAFGHYGNEVDTADEIEKAIRAREQL
jgi:uncharacterized protein YhfF